MSFLRTIARPILASSFIGEGIERLRHTEKVAPEIGKALEPVTNLLPVDIDDHMITRVLGASELAAGALLSIGKFTKISGIVLIKVAAINAIIDWNKADISKSKSKDRQRLTLLKNLSLAGGAMYVLIDRKGKPSHKWVAEQRKRRRTD